MTPREAQSIGRTKTIKATLVCLTVLFIIGFYEETKGDFANGIIFYFHRFFSPANLAPLILVLGCTFLFGGWAGKEIIISKKNVIFTAVKYAALLYTVEYIYLYITFKPPTIDLASGDAPNVFLLIALSSIHLAILILVAWLYATYRLLRIQRKNKTS